MLASSTTLAAALLRLTTSPAAPAPPSVDIVAIRAFADRDTATYAVGEAADVAILYEVHGSGPTLRDVRVHVGVQGGGLERILQFRLREAAAPQPPHEFHVPLDLASLALPRGEYRLLAAMDANDTVPETDEANNAAGFVLRVVTTLPALGQAPGPSPPVTPRAPPAVLAPPPPAPPPSPAAPAQPPGRAAAEPVTEQHRPTSARAMVSSDGPGFEREWEQPLEAGFHPAYGASRIVLSFDHPMGLLHVDESLERAVLVFDAVQVGALPAELGALQARVRAVPAAGAACRPPAEVTLALQRTAGRVLLDLTPVVAPAGSVAASDDCADGLEVTLAFAGQLPRATPVGALVRVDAASVRLETKTRRRG